MKHIPLVAAILFLATGGFLIWGQIRQTAQIKDMRVWVPQGWRVETIAVSNDQYVLFSPDYVLAPTNNNVFANPARGAGVLVDSYSLESGPVSESYLDKVACYPGQQVCTVQKTNYRGEPGRIVRLTETQDGPSAVYVVGYMTVHKGRVYEVMAKYVEKDKERLINDIFLRIRPL